MEYRLKTEYKQFRDTNKVELKQLEQVFFENESEYLRVKQLPKSIKNRIDTLWNISGIDKLRHGFTDILDTELKDLRSDPFCGKNKNKEYWIKAYIMDWLSGYPEILTIEYLMNALSTRESNRILIENCYEVIE